MGRMLHPSRAVTADRARRLSLPINADLLLPATSTLRNGAAFGWSSLSTFVSGRTLGSVRLLVSTPLVQLRAANVRAVLASAPLAGFGD